MCSIGTPLLYDQLKSKVNQAFLKVVRRRCFKLQLNRFWELIPLFYPLPSTFLLFVLNMLGYKMAAEVSVLKKRL